jgi:MFS family permease
MSVVVTAEKASIWRNRSFSILLISGLLLSVGNKIYELVLPLLIYEITNSSVAMASMRTAELLPNFFFAVFIGVLVDRVNKKKWALWMIGSQVVLLTVMAYLAKSGNQNLQLYYLLGFLLLTFGYGYFNVQVSLTKLSVPPDHLTSVNAKFSFVETFVGIMGPSLSGLILLMSNLYDGLFLTAGVFLISFFFLLQLKIEEAPSPSKKCSFLQDLKEGWISFRLNRVLWMLTLVVMFANCSLIVTNTTVIFFAKEYLKLSSSALGIIFAIAGIGGLLGSLLVNGLRKRFGLGVLLGSSIILNGVAYLGMCIANGIGILIAALLLNGFATTLYSVCVYTFRHEQTPAHLIGRISGITGTLFRVGMPVTMYLSGWMSEWWGTYTVFLASAILNLLIFVVYRRTPLWKMT